VVINSILFVIDEKYFAIALIFEIPILLVWINIFYKNRSAIEVSSLIKPFWVRLALCIIEVFGFFNAIQEKGALECLTDYPIVGVIFAFLHDTLLTIGIGLTTNLDAFIGNAIADIAGTLITIVVLVTLLRLYIFRLPFNIMGMFLAPVIEGFIVLAFLYSGADYIQMVACRVNGT
jgi:hypothetical protein